MILGCMSRIPTESSISSAEKSRRLSLHREVNDILKELEERKKGVVQKHNIGIGDKVKITDGVFVNFIGTVTEVFHEKGRLSVMVSIFGRDTRVDDLEFWQVEQVPARARRNINILACASHAETWKSGRNNGKKTSKSH